MYSLPLCDEKQNASLEGDKELLGHMHFTLGTMIRSISPSLSTSALE